MLMAQCPPDRGSLEQNYSTSTHSQFYDDPKPQSRNGSHKLTEKCNLKTRKKKNAWG